MIKVTQYTIIEDSYFFFIEGNDRILSKSEIETLLKMGLVNLSQEQYEKILVS